MKHHLLRICLLLMGSLIPFKAVHSQAVPPSCDAEYYQVLRNRAFLEGTREVEAAQRIILKADSVLEYSCFHIDLDFVGNWGATFSENGLAPDNPPEFDGGIAIYGGNLDTALTGAVSSSLIGFMESFSHIYGGGTFTIPTAGTVCNPMNVVWAASKCANFDMNWWVGLEQLSARDIRTLPLPCGSGNRSSAISDAYDLIYPAPASPPALGGMETVTSYLGNISGSCTGASAGEIPTGITATFRTGNVNVAVCVNPGCYYNGTACVQ